jgi:peptidoglycan hydrolase-like protein with peptidoglycan-binding domain
VKIMHSLVAAALAVAGTTAVCAADALFVDANTVRQVQKTLADRGYRTGAADGRMGPQTQAAVRRFQRAEHLEPTGQLNRQTLVAMGVQKADASANADEPRYDRDTIRRVQQTLSNRGFKAGAADGILSERTHAALRQFQKSENLETTGRLNERTLAALGVPEEVASAGSSRPAAEPASSTIRELQRKLSSRGYHVGAADGVMGPATRAAIKDFQRAENLEVTGRPNRETLSALGVEGAMAAAR